MGDCRFSIINAVKVIVFIALMLEGSLVLADVEVSQIAQTPPSPTEGDEVTYSFYLENTSPTQDAGIIISVLKNGELVSPITERFESDSCSSFNSFDFGICSSLGENGDRKKYSFTWNPPIGTTRLEFDVICTPTCKLTPDGRIPFTTIVRPKEPGNAAFHKNSDSVNENTGEVKIDLIRENGSDGPLSTLVLLGFSGDSATEGGDYTVPDFQQRVVSWGDQDVSTKTITVPIINDNVIEESEFFTAYFTENGTSIIKKSIITIVDTSQPGNIHFDTRFISVDESEGNVIFTVLREEGAEGDVVVDILTGGQLDTAQEETDYRQPSPTQLIWRDGDSAPKTFKISIVRDTEFESAETFSVKLVRNQETIDTVAVNITDASFSGTAEVDRIEVLSGDGQRFLPASDFSDSVSFEDLVVKVLFSETQPISGLPIEWTATPPGAGSFTASTTLTDIQGVSSNHFTPITTERIVVRATVKTSGAAIQARSLQVRAEEEDPFVEFILNPGIADTAVLGDNQRKVAIAMDAACPALSNKLQNEGLLSTGELDLLDTCLELQSGDPADVANRLELLAHEEIITQGSALIEGGNLQVMNVNSRLNAIRGENAGTIDVSGLNVSLAGQRIPGVLVKTLLTGGSAGDQGLYSPWSVFMNGEISFGDKAGTLSESGFKFSTVGLTGGMDYRVSSSAVVGLSLGYSANKSDLSGNAGDMDMSAFYLTGYGTYYQTDQIFVDGLLSFGFNRYDTQRRVSDISDPLQFVSGDTDGATLSLSISGGYDYNKGAITMMPYGRLGYMLASIDKYTETASKPDSKGAGSILEIGQQDLDSLTTVVGGQLSYTVSGTYAVFLPQFRFEWEREFLDDSREISAHFIHDPTTTEFSISSDSPDRNYFNLGLGFSAVAADGKSGFLYYETRLDQNDVTQHWFKSGIRIEF